MAIDILLIDIILINIVIASINIIQLSPRVPIDIEGTVYCFTYVETYLISYHNIYFCEQAIYFATIHIAPILRCSVSLNILQN